MNSRCNILNSLADVVHVARQLLERRYDFHGCEAENPIIASSLSFFATLYQDRGNQEGAALMAQESLYTKIDIHEQNATHPLIATLLGNLACLDHEKGIFQEGESNIR